MYTSTDKKKVLSANFFNSGSKDFGFRVLYTVIK